MVATLASIADLPDSATADLDAASRALVRASGQIRSACGWSITEETVSMQVPDGWWSRQPSGTWLLFLPTLNLTALSVTSGGIPLVDGLAFRWSSAGVVHLSSLFRPPCYGFLRPQVTVTFTHGYPVAPDPVRDACVDLVVESTRNPEGLVSATAGPFTEVYLQRGETPRTAENDARLRPFMLPSLA